jgi:hypothetical protein
LICAVSLAGGQVLAGQEVAMPITISRVGGTVTLRNVSDRYVEVGLLLEGKNFSARRACVWRMYLPAGQGQSFDIAAKDRSLPADFRVTVTDFSAKTDAEVLADQGGRLPPAPKLVPPEVVARIQPVVCESK